MTEETGRERIPEDRQQEHPRPVSTAEQLKLEQEEWLKADKEKLASEFAEALEICAGNHRSILTSADIMEWCRKKVSEYPFHRDPDQFEDYSTVRSDAKQPFGDISDYCVITVGVFPGKKANIKQPYWKTLPWTIKRQILKRSRKITEHEAIRCVVKKKWDPSGVLKDTEDNEEGNFLSRLFGHLADSCRRNLTRTVEEAY